MSAQMNQRLANLAPRLMAYSNFIHSPELTRDDITQEMALALLEKDQRQPAFAEQTDAYLVKYAMWMAGHEAEKTLTYQAHVPSSIEDIQTDDEITSGVEIYELLPDESTPDPEEIACQHETYLALVEAVQALSPENQLVVTMFYDGYTWTEIAGKLGISKQAVNARRNTIAKALHELRE